MLAIACQLLGTLLRNSSWLFPRLARLCLRCQNGCMLGQKENIWKIYENIWKYETRCNMRQYETMWERTLKTSGTRQTNTSNVIMMQKRLWINPHSCKSPQYSCPAYSHTSIHFAKWAVPCKLEQPSCACQSSRQITNSHDIWVYRPRVYGLWCSSARIGVHWSTFHIFVHSVRCSAQFCPSTQLPSPIGPPAWV